MENKEKIYKFGRIKSVLSFSDKEISGGKIKKIGKH